MGFWSKEDKNAALSEDQVLGVLKQVQDPDLHKDIVALGFIRNLKIDGGKVSFDLNLTTPACPVKDQMRDEAVRLVKGLPGVENVEVKMTSEVRSMPQLDRSALKGVRNIGHELRIDFGGCPRLIALPAVFVRVNQEMVRAGMIRILRQDFAVNRLRVRQVARPMQGDGLLQHVVRKGHSM